MQLFIHFLREIFAKILIILIMYESKTVGIYKSCVLQDLPRQKLLAFH